MGIQNDTTLDAKHQFGLFFLQNTPHVQDISKQALPCMIEACILTISFMFILEGISTIQIWLMIQAKYQFHVDPWLILSEFQPLHEHVHVRYGHASFICNFARHLKSH